MSAVKLETLTPVHIGSGNFLQYNTEFVQDDMGNEPHLAVVSQEKLGKIIGEQHLDNWLEALAKRENIKTFLKRFAPEAQTKDFAERRMPVFCKINEKDTLKECIRNGMGLPYIPGSSIKGAIRTAVLASLTHQINDIETKIEVQDKQGRTTVEASQIEKELFGSEPNSDVFRFIQVGDAYFQKDTEIATRLISLNIRRRAERLQDDTSAQLVEAIGTDSKSTFQMQVTKSYYEFVKRLYPPMGQLPVASLDDLFHIINEFTRKLVEDEIRFWRNIDKAGGDDYVDEMEKILQEINRCKAGVSCVLRIGHASGWRFITGAWTEELKNFKTVVIPAAQPNYRNYVEYDFPKTRRLDEDSFIFGFVKLSMI